MDSSRRAVESYWRSRMEDGVTVDEDKIVPVYKIEEICELLRTSHPSIVKEVSEFILKRLDHESPISKQKRKRIDAEDSNDESRIHIPEDILTSHCTGYQEAKSLAAKRAEIDSELVISVQKWNSEFVKVKYLYGKYKKRYLTKIKELTNSKSQLEACRTELSIMTNSLSFQQQEVDHIRNELLEARAETGRALRSFKNLKAKMSSVKTDYKKKEAELLKKELAIDSLKIIEDFKSSLAFQSIIQDKVEEARDRIYDVEVKHLERQSYDDGFIIGFYKGIRLVHRRTGADIEGLTYSQVSGDPVQDADIVDDAQSVLPLYESDVDIV